MAKSLQINYYNNDKLRANYLLYILYIFIVVFSSCNTIEEKTGKTKEESFETFKIAVAKIYCDNQDHKNYADDLTDNLISNIASGFENIQDDSLNFPLKIIRIEQSTSSSLKDHNNRLKEIITNASPHILLTGSVYLDDIDTSAYCYLYICNPNFISFLNNNEHKDVFEWDIYEIDSLRTIRVNVPKSIFIDPPCIKLLYESFIFVQNGRLKLAEKKINILQNNECFKSREEYVFVNELNGLIIKEKIFNYLNADITQNTFDTIMYYFDFAIQNYEEGIKSVGNKADLHYQRGSMIIEMRIQYAKISELYGFTPRIEIEKYNNRDIRSAINSIALAVKYDPNNQEYLHKLENICRRIGRLELYYYYLRNIDYVN